MELCTKHSMRSRPILPKVRRLERDAGAHGVYGVEYGRAVQRVRDMDIAPQHLQAATYVLEASSRAITDTPVSDGMHRPTR